MTFYYVALGKFATKKTVPASDFIRIERTLTKPTLNRARFFFTCRAVGKSENLKTLGLQ